jgi:hypothetical protein
MMRRVIEMMKMVMDKTKRTEKNSRMRILKKWTSLIRMRPEVLHRLAESMHLKLLETSKREQRLTLSSTRRMT